MDNLHIRNNNFDLIRLFAALQVALFHSYEHMHFPSTVLNRCIYALRFFPGVPIFFFISGFLIYASYDRAPVLKNYFRNRFLRLYPGLWVCILVMIVLLSATGYITAGNMLSGQFAAWVAAQATFLQFYTPPMLRRFGVGNPNGALWTLSVEVGFYLFVPVLFWLFRTAKLSRNAWLFIWIAISIACNIWYQPYKHLHERSEMVKLLGVNVMPYLFYFLLGSLVCENWERLRRWYEAKGLLWLLVYVAYCLVYSVWLQRYRMSYWVSGYQFIAVLLLVQAVVSQAFTARHLSGRLLGSNDISYGVYIYHMPIVNLLIALGYAGNNSACFIALGATLLLGVLSWRWIERPALATKRSTMRHV